MTANPGPSQCMINALKIEPLGKTTKCNLLKLFKFCSDSCSAVDGRPYTRTHVDATFFDRGLNLVSKLLVKPKV
jgi:hypothetical protein